MVPTFFASRAEAEMATRREGLGVRKRICPTDATLHLIVVARILCGTSLAGQAKSFGRFPKPQTSHAEMSIRPQWRAHVGSV
jgi:hypothetical protein